LESPGRCPSKVISVIREKRGGDERLQKIRGTDVSPDQVVEAAIDKTIKAFGRIPVAVITFKVPHFSQLFLILADFGQIFPHEFPHKISNLEPLNSAYLTGDSDSLLLHRGLRIAYFDALPHVFFQKGI
jgi:hypothetical protein